MVVQFINDPDSKIACEINSDKWLIFGKKYIVLEICINLDNSVYFRLASDLDDKPVFFEAKYFKVISPKLEQDWIFISLPSSFRIAPSKAIEDDLIWEKFIDGDIDSIKWFSQYYNSLQKNNKEFL
ncbi:hypothetical protein EHQ47_04995 [Leptospira bourretii]|uniref:hypothetical protein n=1 Tax=Leptospira bourretii TaxID=2484962 RepID=UPI001090E85C|nr:hypothetical protein [Leptospira bourretii]TGL23749.1 hypothetical protein EHQ47_04995 [Leptospira bourretii]